MWQAATPTEPVPASTPRAKVNLAAIPPQLLVSAALSVGVVLLFLSNLLIALGEPVGTAGNVRLLQFLSPADLAVGAVLIVAVALVALLPPADESKAASSPLEAEDARLLAGFVAVAVAAAAVVRAIVVLTIAGEHAALRLGNMVDGLAALLVAAVAAYWALASK